MVPIGPIGSPIFGPCLEIIHDLACVRRLSDLCLDMYERCYRSTSSSLRLLEMCPLVEHVQVSLSHYNCDLVLVFLLGEPDAATFKPLATADDLTDLAPEGAAQFASVTNLQVDTTSLPDDQLVAGVSLLLFRCPRLKSLSIKLPVNWVKTCTIRGKKHNLAKI